MSKKNDSWGIEVGANALKAVRLVRNGSEVELADFEIMPFKQILTTPDLDTDEAIQIQLDAFLSKHDISHSTVIASVPGHLAFARFAKLPPVEPKKVPDIVRFEAVQQIPFPIEQVEWDYQTFQQQDSPDVEVGIFAITKERVLNYLSNFRRVDLRLDGLTLSPLAVYNAFQYEQGAEPSEDGTVYLDVGTSSTDVIIVEQGGIWLRTLPIGGNNFTEALVRAFKLSFPKAERLKREAGTSKHARQIFQAMRPVFADLVQELQRSIGYYQSLNREANLKRLVSVGSTFRLPGLQKFLKQQIQLDVSRPNGFQRLQVEGKSQAEVAQNAMNMATAYGLALQGVGLQTVEANLLPRHIIMQRLWKAKQPWFGAAAASLALAAGVVGVTWWLQSREHQKMEARNQAPVARVLGQARQYESQWDQAKGDDPRQQMENMRRIPDYRDLWPTLLADVSRGLASISPSSAQGQGQGGSSSQAGGTGQTSERQIFLEHLTSEYEARTANPGTGGSQQEGQGQQRMTVQQKLSQSYQVSDFWPASNSSAAGAGSEGADTPSSEVQSPHFNLTLTGVSTANPTRTGQLLNRLVSWLEQYEAGGDRPYHFQVNPVDAIVSIEPIERSFNNQEGGGRGINRPPQPPQPPQGRAPQAMPGMAGPAEEPRQAPRAGGGFGRGFGGGGGQSGIEDLLPRRYEGQTPPRTRFEVQWTVVLEKPEQAREDEKEGQPSPPPSPQATQSPPETTPGEPGQASSRATQAADRPAGMTATPSPSPSSRPARDQENDA